MTHLGLNTAVVIASGNYEVVCFDFNSSNISQLKNGDTVYSEPELQDYLDHNKERLFFTSNQEDLKGIDLIYVCPDVPTNKFGTSDLKIVDRYLELASASVKELGTIVLLSQVPPGFTRQKINENFTLVYQVETLIFGRAIERAREPERYIIGMENETCSLPDKLQSLLRQNSDIPIFKMSYESAELAKIAINCCLVASVSVANTLAELCEAIGANWMDIEKTLRADRRIGQFSYLKTGLGLSGGNLERDLNTVINLGEKNLTNTEVVRSWVSLSGHRKRWGNRIFNDVILPEIKNPKIGVLGLAYKENTNSIKNSPAVTLLEDIEKFEVKVFDPIVKGSALPNLKHSDDIAECVNDVNVLFVMTPWEDFFHIDPEIFDYCSKLRFVVDPYGCLKALKTKHEVKYYALGVRSEGGCG
jgi:UDPglucose 6-dehydrogenase